MKYFRACSTTKVILSLQDPRIIHVRYGEMLTIINDDKLSKCMNIWIIFRLNFLEFLSFDQIELLFNWVYRAHREGFYFDVRMIRIDYFAFLNRSWIKVWGNQFCLRTLYSFIENFFLLPPRIFLIENAVQIVLFADFHKFS